MCKTFPVCRNLTAYPTPKSVARLTIQTMGRTGFYFSGGYILGGRNTSRIQRITFGMVIKIGRVG